MAVSRRLRFEILRRDDHTCRYCGGRAPDVALTVDHVKPVALGGSDEPENLVTACAACNGGKSSVPADAATVADVADDAIRWKQAIEICAWARASEREFLTKLIIHFDATWSGWTISEGEGRRTIERPPDWEETVRRFAGLGLDGAALDYYVDIAMKKPRLATYKVWNYFCGCCWNEINRLQEEAKAMIAWQDAARRQMEQEVADAP